MENEIIQNILIVDDRPENLLALESVLEKPDRNFIKASSGKETLGILLKNDISLILLDVQMPEMNGFETATLIRGSNRTKHIPIIFISAISKEQKHVFKGYESGAIDYIFKPFDPDIMRNKVNILLEIDKKSRIISMQNKELIAAKKNTDNILANVKEGLFLLDKDLIVKPEYSRALEYILGFENLDSKNLMDLLKNHIPEKIFKSTPDYIKLLFNTDVTNEVVAKLNPFIKVEYNVKGESGYSNQIKYLSFYFKRLYNEKEIEELMVTVIDQTHEILLKDKLNQTKKQVKDQMEWLVKILHIDPPSLQEFIEGAEMNINHIDKTVKKISKDKKDNEKLDFKEILEEIYRAVHTIKGNASLIDLQYFCNETHEFENEINSLKDNKNIDRKDLIPLVTHLRNLQRAMTKIKGLIEKINHFYKNFRPKREYEGELLIKSLKNLVLNLSNRTGKNVQIIHKDFDPVTIPFQYRITVKDILIQLANNAIYHGIETPEKRIKNKKEPVGLIEIESIKKANEFCFRFYDDGQGLDIEKLRTMIKKMGRWKKENIDSWDNDKIANLIFEPGVTTSEKEELIAGRGVGMDLVKKRIDKYNGHIELKSEANKFCEFIISLPK